MNPTAKYFLARMGMFLGIGAVLLPTGLNLLVIAMAALMASMVLSFFTLKRWRTEMIDHVDATMRRRREEKARLRAALAGEDDEG